MALIMLRHTRPIGAEGLCYGRTDLLPDASFTDEVARLTQELPTFTSIWSSPLTRCRLLAEALGAARGQTPRLDDRLAEMDFGAWENTPWDAVSRDALTAWSADFLHARPHGGESVAMLLSRTRAALDDAAKCARPVLVVAHAGVIRAALAHQGHNNPWQAPIDFAGHLTLEWS